MRILTKLRIKLNEIIINPKYSANAPLNLLTLSPKTTKNSYSCHTPCAKRHNTKTTLIRYKLLKNIFLSVTNKIFSQFSSFVVARSSLCFLEIKMVKFTGSFQSPLEFGHVIVISGIARQTAENFFVNFLGDKASGDIPLHLNVVFGENEQIIRNTKINGEC